jgi:hypothetical protein
MYILKNIFIFFRKNLNYFCNVLIFLTGNFWSCTRVTENSGYPSPSAFYSNSEIVPGFSELVNNSGTRSNFSDPIISTGAYFINFGKAE